MSEQIMWKVTLHPNADDDSVFAVKIMRKTEVVVDLFDSFKILKTIHVRKEYTSGNTWDEYAVYNTHAGTSKLAQLTRCEHKPYSTDEAGSFISELSTITWTVVILKCDFGDTIIKLLSDIYKDSVMECAIIDVPIAYSELEGSNIIDTLDEDIVSYFKQQGYLDDNNCIPHIIAINVDANIDPLTHHTAITAIFENFNFVTVQDAMESGRSRNGSMVFYVTRTSIFINVEYPIIGHIITVSSAIVNDSATHKCITYVIRNNNLSRMNSTQLDYINSIMRLIHIDYHDNIIASNCNI
jgi:hypothetical protein